MSKFKRYGILGIICIALIVLVSRLVSFEYAYTPPENKTPNENRSQVSIRNISTKEEAGTDAQIELGKQLFFEETFGNEVFFTDILGMFDGPLSFQNMTKALVKLGGKGTTNLQVEAAESFTAGDFHVEKGDLIDTGIDVAKGTLTPVGINIVYDEGRMKAGITCAACHASLDDTGRVVEGIPNTDLNIGLALAMGSNTASYFTHTQIDNFESFVRGIAGDESVKTSTGEEKTLPDPQLLEEFVDAEMVKWPLGSNDTTIEKANNPVQIPDTFTLGDHPYGWSGQGQIGPFRGLSAAINNAHAQNMDAVSQSEISGPVLGIDKELYLAILLQNASNEKYRFDPNGKESPSEFFARVDPTPGVPGVNELIPSPSFPKISYMSAIGLYSSSPGYNTWEQLNGMSAYMNSLVPPKTELPIDHETYTRGKDVYRRAGCISCHGGKNLTSNELVTADEVGTDPSRAKAFKATQSFFSPPQLYAEGTPVPLPRNPKLVNLVRTKEEDQKLQLAWGQANPNGAYKTISLLGLNWSAPYLHDGGVAVGKNNELGLPNTLLKGVPADPYNSLKAMVDSQLRSKVIKENLKAESLSSAHVSGKGHEYWVDNTTGFTKKEQEALLYYLLRVTDVNTQR